MGMLTNAYLFYGILGSEDDALLWKHAEQKAGEEYGSVGFSNGKAGVIIGSHCSDEYPIPYLAITEAHFEANRGRPVSIEREKMQVDPDWERRLQEFAQKFKIPIEEDEQSGWHLVSYHD